MAVITIEAEADHSIVLQAMLESTKINPVDIIMAIDEYISCESFTLRVIKELSESMFNDYDEHSQYLAGQVLKDLTGESSPITPYGAETTQERWEKISALRDKLSQLVKLITEVNDVVQ